MNKLFWGLALIVISFNAKSQDNNLTITASGSGNSENTAINSALRSAIEKTFGVFISSSTTIHNDNLVSDDIASVSSGNIVSYQIIDQKTDGAIFQVTLSAVLSPQRIVQSFKEKGFKEFELNGNVYQQNIIKEKFYKEQEPIIIEEFFKKYESVRIFDTYQIKVCEPFKYIPVHYPNQRGYDEFSKYRDLVCGFSIRHNERFDNYSSHEGHLCTGEVDYAYYNSPKDSTSVTSGEKVIRNPYLNWWRMGKQAEFHYVLPVIYTPIYNTKITNDLSKAIMLFLKTISINDFSEYAKRYGDSYKLCCLFPVNEKGKSKRTQFNFYLRNSESIKVIAKYMSYFLSGVDANCLFFENFTPTMTSLIIKNKFTYSTIPNGLYQGNFIKDFNWNSDFLISLLNQDIVFENNYSYYSNIICSYDPSLLLLEVSEEELGKLVNLKVLRN